MKYIALRQGPLLIVDGLPFNTCALRSLMPRGVYLIDEEGFMAFHNRPLKILAPEPILKGLRVLAESFAPKVRKAQREQRLQSTDWLLMRHMDEMTRHVATSLDEKHMKTLLEFRQKLRDVPEGKRLPRFPSTLQKLKKKGN